MIVIIEAARDENLVTLEKVKSSLGITDSQYDERLKALIGDVSSSIVQYCGKRFAREAVTERLDGYGDTTLMLDRCPVIVVSEVRQDDTVVTASRYSIADPVSGCLYNENGWADTQPRRQWIDNERVNQRGRQAHAIDYVGGYLMPADSFLVNAACSASGVESAFYLPGTGCNLWPLLASGEQVCIAGFNDPTNNGTFTVLERTPERLVVDTTLVTEPASGVVSINVHLRKNITLPKDLERIALMEISARYHTEPQDPTLKSESIGDWSASYSVAAPETESGFTKDVEKALIRYTRIV